MPKSHPDLAVYLNNLGAMKRAKENLERADREAM